MSKHRREHKAITTRGLSCTTGLLTEEALLQLLRLSNASTSYKLLTKKNISYRLLPYSTAITARITRSSATAEGLRNQRRRAMTAETLSTAAQLYEKSHFKRPTIDTLPVTQGYRKWWNSITS